MRVGAEDRLSMPCGEGQERAAKLVHGSDERQDVLALPHPVRRHRDVVPATRGVKASSSIFTAPIDDQALDVEKEVFPRRVVRDRADIRQRQRVERVADRTTFDAAVKALSGRTVYMPFREESLGAGTTDRIRSHETATKADAWDQRPTKEIVFRDKVQADGTEVVSMGHAEFTPFIRNDMVKMKRIVEMSGARID